LNICKAALKNKVSKIIHTSSSDVYGNTKYVPTNEEHPLQAQSPYSASKIGAESLAMSFYYSSNLPLIIARPFNTYGPGQSALAIIPTIISQIASGKKQILLGDVTPTRDFSYITDTCNAFLLLAKCDNAVGEIVNIGSNTEISIMDLLNAIKELMHSDVEYLTETNRLRPVGSELKRVWCDNTKIKSLTGYKPEISLTEGLMNTIEWYSDKSRLAEYNTLYEAK
jgi:nucleoside-diphosphate-sugar epimerase